MDITPKACDFMDKSFITLKPDMDVYKAIDVLLKKNITSAPVVDKNGKLVGVLSEKDCLRILVHGAYSELPGGKVSELMTKNVITIHPDLDIFSAADMFFKYAFRCLFVIDKDELIGQISRRDLLWAIQKIKLASNRSNIKR
jgi:CBS domain-containing protein